MDLGVLALSILGRHLRAYSRDGALNLWGETIMLTKQSFFQDSDSFCLMIVMGRRSGMGSRDGTLTLWGGMISFIEKDLL